MPSTTRVLEQHYGTLRAIFMAYAEGPSRTEHKSTAVGWSALDEATLMSTIEYEDFLRDLDLIDEEFSAREARFAFVWSRMRVIDEESHRGRTKLCSLCFEDFLEVLIRIVTMKAMPTDQDLSAEGVADAGLFFLKLRDDGRLSQWIANHPQRWHQRLRQPIGLALHQLILLIIRVVEREIAVPESRLSQHDARSFKKLKNSVPSAR